MTTQAEIEQALNRVRDGGLIDDGMRVWIFHAHLETAQRRSWISSPVLQKAHSQLDFVIVKRHRWKEGTYSVRSGLAELQQLYDACDGTEELKAPMGPVDHVHVRNLLSEMRETQDEIDAIRKAFLANLRR